MINPATSIQPTGTNFPIPGWKSIRTIYTVLKCLSRQKEFLRKNIRPILDDAYASNDGSLDANDLKKITGYYGLAVPAVLGESFCRLHGRTMTEQERWAASSQGAMTGLFDDFFDKQYLSDEAIKELMMATEKTSQKKSNEKLFDLFYKKALQSSPDPAAVSTALEKVYEAQVFSKKQEGNTLTRSEIENITILKGGTSLLFYRSVFSPQAGEQEKELLYELGGLMQVCNDIFDVYKDRESNIKTLVTIATNIGPLRNWLAEKLAACFNLAYDTGFPRKNVYHFLSVISMAVFSRAFVCLDQLEKNERSTNGIFLVDTYNRGQLICDMDTLSNKLRSAKYHTMLMENVKRETED